MKLSIFNVKYSQNLGDGIIAECLTHLLEKASPELKVNSIDLAGRTDFSTSSGRLRQAVLTVLGQFPPSVRQPVMAGLVRRQIGSARETWRQGLAGTKGVIFGGGQLLSDADLNFPLKIAAAMAALPPEMGVVFFGVGASANWSRRGAELLGSALCDPRVKGIFVRDPRSREILESFLDGGHVPIDITADPGIATNLVYGLSPQEQTSPRVGIGVIHPAIEALHHDDRGSAGTGAAFYIDLAQRVSAYARPVFFTNGAREDETFLQQFLAQCSPDLRAAIEVCPQAGTPEELARNIAGFQCLIAHRLHANIVGYSIGIPSVGIIWENKVRDFYRQIGREQFCLDQASRTPEIADEKVRMALAAGGDPGGRDAGIAALEQDIMTVLARLGMPSAAQADASISR